MKRSVQRRRTWWTAPSTDAKGVSYTSEYISETATIAIPKTDKTENYSCGGRRDGTWIFGRKEIYYVHGVGGASRYSDVWTLVADRYYYYYYTYNLPVDLFDIIICLDVYI